MNNLSTTVSIDKDDLKKAEALFLSEREHHGIMSEEAQEVDDKTALLFEKIEEIEEDNDNNEDISKKRSKVREILTMTVKSETSIWNLLSILIVPALGQTVQSYLNAVMP